VAYTTGYGAVMPAYSQPMMSAGQMPHDDVANQQSHGGHTDTGGEEFVGSVETDFTGTEPYYSTESFVPVSDVTDTQCPVEEDVLSDKLVRLLHTRYFTAPCKSSFYYHGYYIKQVIH